MFNSKRSNVFKTWCRKMRILIVVHLWNFFLIILTTILGHASIQPVTFDISIGIWKLVVLFSFSKLFYSIFVLGGVFTDRDEGIDSQTMESIFKYAIFHYNRLPTGLHHLSYKIRIQEETLSLLAADSPVQTVHDGLFVFSWRKEKGVDFVLLFSLFPCPSTTSSRYLWTTLSWTIDVSSFDLSSCCNSIYQCLFIVLHNWKLCWWSRWINEIKSNVN